MSLQTAAEAVRQKGRGEDTMLIHMTPGEVNGLQQLAMAYGGSLTVNPETGLPEANFLKSLLPTIIGVGLAATGMGPIAAGLTVGGLQFARTGDLGQGIMAGLGAYGGADLAGALGSQGAVQGAGATTAQQATQQATQASMVSPAPGLAELGVQTPAGAFSPVASQAAPTGLEIAKAGGFTPATTTAGRLSQMGTGASNVLSSGADGTAARSAVMESLGGTSGAIKTGLAAASGPLAYVPPAEMPDMTEDYNYDGPYVPSERQAQFPTGRDPADSSEFKYFDTVNPAPGFQTMASATPSTTDLSGEPTFAGIPVSLATNPDRMREYQANPNLYSFAEGGGLNMDNGGFVVDAHTVSEIGNGSSDAGHEMLARIGGEPIKGPGDGVSDSIKANIGGVQEARVAKDESYLSRDDVKALGGGDLKKGEKMLYQLMAKAHESRKQKGRGQATGLDKLISRMA